MNEKLIRVFYGADSLPYKDKERTTHFPIVGNAFMGASNVTEIRFYVGRLNALTNQWVAIGKLPNGKKGFKLLGSAVYDSETNEYYYSFQLGNFFTQAKGDLFISLGGYNGADVNLNEDDIYEMLGDIVIEMTGVIKLNIAYAVITTPEDSRIEEWQELLAALSNKLDITNGIVVLLTEHDNLSDYNVDIEEFEENQVFLLTYQPLRGLYYKDSGGSLSDINRFIGYCHRDTTISNGTDLSSLLVEIKKSYCLLSYTNANRLYLKIGESGGYANFSRLPYIASSDSDSITEHFDTFSVNLSTGIVSNLSAEDIVLPKKSYVDDNFAKLDGNNTFTGENVFGNSPQTSETLSGASAGTKLITKQYLIDYLAPHISDYNTLLGVVDGILALIPSTATTSNKLVDRDTMNSTINSLAAFFKGNFDNYSTPQAVGNTTLIGVAWQTSEPNAPYYVSNNDYAYVNDDETHNHEAWRYIYVSGTGWQAQFRVNEAPLTADQLASINSGITSALVSQIGTNQNNISTINSKLPTIKDYVVATNSWSLVDGKYQAEISAGDLVIDDNKQKVYTGVSASDNAIIGDYGIIISSDGTTQKFTLVCYRGDTAPDSTFNFSISQYGGN